MYQFLTIMLSTVLLTGCAKSSSISQFQQSLAWIWSIRFIAYSPSGFDPRPSHRKIPKYQDVLADLHTIRPYFDGLILYSANQPASDILKAARVLKFRGIVLGIWDPADKSELMLAVKLAKRYHRLVKVICIGNEGLTFYRYSRKQLKAAFALVRSKLPRVPLSTSEPITQYGDRMLQSLPDIHLPNIHPSFNLGAKAGVKESVAWVIERAQSLWKVTGCLLYTSPSPRD